MIREHPIILSTDMVKAILEDRKTMTRRVIKPQPVLVQDKTNMCSELFQWGKETDIVNAEGLIYYCPYGRVGDKLWVKETWATEKRLDHLSPSELGRASDVPLWYKADSDQRSLLEKGKWRSGRFMPRWVSRILLEITEIRVDRVDQISYEDAKAEGCISISDFAILWNSLNAKRGYSFNNSDWIWVISFTR